MSYNLVYFVPLIFGGKNYSSAEVHVVVRYLTIVVSKESTPTNNKGHVLPKFLLVFVLF